MLRTAILSKEHLNGMANWEGGNLDLPRNFLIQTLHKLNKAGGIFWNFFKYLCSKNVLWYINVVIIHLDLELEHKMTTFTIVFQRDSNAVIWY